MDDYLFLQPLLIERVKACVPGLAHIGSASSLSEAQDNTAASPTCWIIYLGEDITDGARAKHPVKQHWAAVLTLAYPKQGEAGPLLGKLINALTGWIPENAGQKEPACSPLERTSTRLPVVFENDWLICPLLFTARFFWPRDKA